MDGIATTKCQWTAPSGKEGASRSQVRSAADVDSLSQTSPDQSNTDADDHGDVDNANGRLMEDTQVTD